MLLVQILRGIRQVADIYFWVMIIWGFSSWMPDTREIGLIRFCGRLTEPYVNVFRRLIPSFGGMDFSYLIALFVYQWGVDQIIRLLWNVLR